MAGQVRINGNHYSWGSITVKVNGKRINGFTALSYGDKLERTMVYANGRSRKPRGRTRGKYVPDEATLTGMKDLVQDLRRELANAAGSDNFADIRFEVVAQYSEDGLGDHSDTLEDCVWSGSSISVSEGTDALTEDVTFQPLAVRRNGLAIFEEDA